MKSVYAILLATTIMGCTPNTTLVCNREEQQWNKFDTAEDVCIYQIIPSQTIISDDDKDNIVVHHDQSDNDDEDDEDDTNNEDDEDHDNGDNHSDHPKGNNGWGNGDQDPPGNSGSHNNAENNHNGKPDPRNK